MQPLNMDAFQTMTHDSHEVLFFYTAFCGTCQLGERMLEIAEAALGEQAPPIYSCRIAEWQALVQDWRIESVPALIFIKNATPIHKIYAFQSVPDLVNNLKGFLEN